MALRTIRYHFRSNVRFLFLFAALLATLLTTASASTSDPVLEWIGIANDTVIANPTSPIVTGRLLAILSASVFDAVNGIEPRYKPFHVRTGAPRNASAKAAAIQAAYAILIKVYPTMTPPLTLQRDASINALKGESITSVNAGIGWGQSVADAIWTWRLTDGIAPPPPPFVGVLGIVASPNAIGVWRPTPLANAPGAGSQFATMTPWVLNRPSLFRPPPPNALASAAYATDYNEIKTMGVYSGSPRSSDQSELVLFWAGNTPLYWDRIAEQLAAAHSFGLTHNAHLFALLNVTMADATIACWDAKYRYVFWRPITAIRSGDLDGNTATDPDATWVPWLDSTPTGTPPHPEYPSGHSAVSGSAAEVLAGVFGEDTPITVTSDVRPETRTFPSFSAVVAEIVDARVFGGIHFRTSCVRGNALGKAVAEYISTHAFRSKDDDEDH